MSRRKRRAAPEPPGPPTLPPARRRLRVAIAATLALLALAAAGLLARHRAASRPNLVLVTIDTLRADRVGAYGYAGAETPALDGLARRGARFEQAQSPVPLTGPSHSTILTGQYPPVHGVRENVTFRLGDRHPTLAAILKKQGYRTAAFVAAYPLARVYGFGQGFDHYNEDFRETPVGGQGAERPGNEVADRAIEWLSRGDGPFFTWLHFYDPHSPYRAPAPYGARFADRPYDGEVAFADAQVGRVLEALRAAGLEEDTVVAVLSDHGEGLGEHGEATHGILIYEATLRVPFVVAGPDVGKGVVVPTRVGLVDVLPTLLGLLGVGPPPDLPGRDLRPALRGEPIRPEPLYAESLFGRLTCRWSSLRGFAGGEWKLVEGAEPELFDLSTDPGETRNLAAREPERLERMRGLLRAAVQKMAPAGDTAKAAALSPEQEERLRSLGYAGGGGGAGALDEPGLPDPRTHVHVYERVLRATLAHGPAVAPALADVASAVREDPGNPFAHFVLGSLAYRDGRFGVAAQAYERALGLDPDRPNMRLAFGGVLRDLDRRVESERQLRIALGQTTPDDDRTRIALAETLTALGKTDEARTFIDAALARAPRHGEALVAKARLLVAQGREGEAVQYLERAGQGQELDPWVELGELYLRMGQPARARESAGRALAQASAHPWALSIRGHALILEGRREEGLAALRAALLARPRRPDAWLSLARAFSAAGDAREAALCRRHAEAARRA
jgi:arylsulfatase A-like enzyme/Tfp pilus assembly protein PilF